MTDYEVVRERFDYSAITGALAWKRSPNRKCPVGSLAGSLCRYGYVRVTIRLADGKRRNYAAHRIAWLWMFGAWPANELDHINGERNDNRIANLRDVDRSTNGLNRRGADRDSKTGVRGVAVHRDGFVAQARVRGKHYYFGRFSTVAEAAKARSDGFAALTQEAA